MIPEILYADNHLIVVLKPAGLITQGDISGAPSLLDGIKEYLRQRDHKPGNAYLGLGQEGIGLHALYCRVPGSCEIFIRAEKRTSCKAFSCS